MGHIGRAPPRDLVQEGPGDQGLPVVGACFEPWDVAFSSFSLNTGFLPLKYTGFITLKSFHKISLEQTTPQKKWFLGRSPRVPPAPGWRCLRGAPSLGSAALLGCGSPGLVAQAASDAMPGSLCLGRAARSAPNVRFQWEGVVESRESAPAPPQSTSEP